MAQKKPCSAAGLATQAGVDSIADLTEVGEKARGGKTLEPYRELLSHESAAIGKSVPKYKRFPIPDTSIIDDDGYDDIIKYTQSEMDAGRVVYVHCWGGKGRTCTVIGCWLIDHETTALKSCGFLHDGGAAESACPARSRPHQIHFRR